MMRPKVLESRAQWVLEETWNDWSGDAVHAGGAWYAGPATYASGSAPNRALDDGDPGNYLHLVGARVYGVTEGFITGNEFITQFATAPASLSLLRVKVALVAGPLAPGDQIVPATEVTAAWGATQNEVTDVVELGTDAWQLDYAVSNPAESDTLTVRTGHSDTAWHLWSIEVFPFQCGMWPLRQRQSAIRGSWPLRQRQNGRHSGSWPLRQRQSGV